MQLVMFFTQSQAHCRHSTHRPSSSSSSSSLGSVIMPLCPPPCLHSNNMSPATPETIKHWTYFMPTASRHTTHPPSLPREYLITTWWLKTWTEESEDVLKNSYRRKMVNQLQQRNVRGVWKSLKIVSGQRTPDSQAAGDQTCVNDLNLFFNRFDQTSYKDPSL